MRIVLVAALLALGSTPQTAPPPVQVQPLPQPKVAFNAASDARGALLRWNFTGARYPEGGFNIYRRDPHSKDPILVTPRPVRRTPPADAATLLGRAIKPHVPKPGVVPPEAQRARDAAIGLRAQTDARFAKAYGLSAEDTTARLNGPEVAYELRALDAAGKETLWAVSGHVTPGRVVPVPPPVLKPLQLLRDPGVLLRWTPADPGDVKSGGYHVLRDGKRITEQAVVVMKEPDDPDPPEGAYVDRGIKPGEPHTYAVVAVDGFGRESAPAAAPPVTWRDTTPPARPVPLEVEPEGEGVRLRWPRPADADLAGYHVYRSTAGAAPAKLTKALLAAGTLTFDDVPPAGVDVTYAVTSVDATGNESVLQHRVTNDIGALVDRIRGGAPYRLVDKTPPAVPAGLAAKLENGIAYLTWTASPDKDLLSYTVERATKADGPWKRISEALDARFSEQLRVPAFGAEWFYRVSAVDKDGNRSEPSAAKSLKAAAIIPRRAAAPGNVRAAGVRTIPATAKITINREAKTIDYEGYVVKMDAVIPPNGKPTGKLRVPYFDADLSVAVTMENDVVKDLEVATPNQTITYAPLGIYVKVTEIDFLRNAVGLFLMLNGTISIGAPSKAAILDLPFEDLSIDKNGIVGSGILGGGRPIRVGSFEFEVDHITLIDDRAQKWIDIGASVSIHEDVADVRTSIRLKPNGVLECDPLSIRLEKAGVGIRGSAKLKDNASAFEGDVTLSVLAMNLEAKVVVGKIGGPNSKSYLGVYHEFELPAGIPIGSSGLMIYKFAGGIGLNMVAAVNGDKVDFAPRNGKWSFLARVGVKTIDGVVLDGMLTLKIESGPTVELRGDAKLLKKVTASAVIRMGPDGFLCSAEVGGNFGPLARGHGKVEIFFGRGAGNWHIFLGTEDDPMQGTVLGALSASFYFQITPAGNGVEIKCGISQDFDTGRCEAWIFYGRAYLGFQAKFKVTPDFDFTAEFYARGGVEAGACVEDWGCVDFSLRCRAHIRLRVSPNNFSVHGSFRVGADLPLLGYESVGLSF